MTEKVQGPASYFPSIEKKYGMPMSHWFAQMEKVAGKKYPEQIAFLRENHGFSQAHANALVMYSRGSKSSKRFNTLEEYLKPFDADKKRTVKAIFKAAKAKHPKMEIVIAWNQPMVKLDKHYIFGASASSKHVLIAPWDQKVLKEFAPKFKEGNALKKTIQLPIDWEVDAKLIQAVIKASISNLK